MPIKNIIQDDKEWPIYIWTNDYENSAKEQLKNIAKFPFINHHIAAMPDVHVGKGATIGSVILTKNVIIPAAVGVDIGCGMIACRLSLTENELDEKKIEQVYYQILRDVPVGRKEHKEERALILESQPYFNNLKKIIPSHDSQ